MGAVECPVSVDLADAGMRAGHAGGRGHLRQEGHAVHARLLKQLSPGSHQGILGRCNASLQSQLHLRAGRTFDVAL